MLSFERGRQQGCRCGRFAGLFRTRAKPIPEENRADGEKQNQGGNWVCSGRDSAAEARPYFERQGVVATDEEKSDRDFVERQCENQESGRDQRDSQVRERYTPESSPGIGAEIQGGFFLRAVHLLQAGEDFGSGDRNQRGAMAERDGNKAEFHSNADEQHEKRETGDDSGENQGKKDESAKQRF